MLSDRAKRNVWLTFAILSVGIIIDRVIGVADGSAEWYSLVCAFIITLFCVKTYICYRKKVKVSATLRQKRQEDIRYS